jgi:hypothetical protein
MFDAAFMNFDWAESDAYWRGYMSREKRVTFTNITGRTLCSLIDGISPPTPIVGVVVYDPDRWQGNTSSREWMLPIAVTIAAQKQLLPVTPQMLVAHSCLTDLPVVEGLRAVPWATNMSAAWDWAFVHLLPNASKSVAFNLHHYAPAILSDPQSNATLSSIDYAVQQRAFISNFRTAGDPASAVNPLFRRAMAGMEPQYSSYGWTDNEFGFVWMSQSTGAGADGSPDDAAAGGGGAVYCRSDCTRVHVDFMCTAGLIV